MIFENGSSETLRVRVHGEGAERIISLEGEVDLATARYLNDGLSVAMGEHPAVLIVDLSGLTFMDSAGVGSLLEAREQCSAQRCRLIVVLGRSRIKRVLEISGVLPVFEFVTDLDEAISLSADSEGASSLSTSGSRDRVDEPR